MKCYLCSKKGARKEQKGRAICDKCFCKLLEKRIRKYARINKFFKKNDKLLVKGDMNKYLIKSMNLPVKFAKKNYNKIVMEWSLDDSINEFMGSLFNDKKIGKVSKKEIRLLECATDQEIILFAKIKKLKFKANKKNKDVQKFLEEVNERHTGAKFGLLRNIKELNKLVK